MVIHKLPCSTWLERKVRYNNERFANLVSTNITKQNTTKGKKIKHK